MKQPLLPDARRQVEQARDYVAMIWRAFSCHDVEYHHIAEAVQHLDAAEAHLLKAIKEHAVSNGVPRREGLG